MRKYNTFIQLKKTNTVKIPTSITTTTLTRDQDLAIPQLLIASLFYQ